MIATARIVMPKAMVRLSAGSVRFSMPEQALCFLAGANSIFTGEKLLTTPNNDFDADQLMFKLLGLVPKAPSSKQRLVRKLFPVRVKFIESACLYSFTEATFLSL